MSKYMCYISRYICSIQIFDYHSDNSSSRFDNFQFVDFHAAQRDSKNPEAAVSLAALMEVIKNRTKTKRKTKTTTKTKTNTKNPEAAVSLAALIDHRF